jgi:heme/copper-type cytochrome/quinol oxidase subunit 3
MNIEARDQDMVLRLRLTHGWYSIRRGVIYGQVITILLAGLFTSIQLWEYYNAPFTLTDGVFGSTFYFATGFHGLHIIIGSICLLVALCRLATNQMTLTYHLGHESAIIYWHFVDVVWLFLFICIYWWG